MRVAMAVMVGAACALTSGGRELPVAPPPRAKPTDADWLPKRGSNSKAKWYENIAPDPPSAFPDICISVTPEMMNDIAKYWTSYKERCPRLFGTTGLKVSATDGVLQKLLKARLHQGSLEFQEFQRRSQGNGPGPEAEQYRECLLDMQAAATELWTGQPKELVPWVEEMVVASKELERLMRVRVSVGTAHPSTLHAATRTRLKIEAELWKAKNSR
jgi:hypothetical protein